MTEDSKGTLRRAASAKPASAALVPVAEQAGMTPAAIAQAILDNRLRPGADSLRRLAEAVLTAGAAAAKTKKDKAAKKAKKAKDGGKKAKKKLARIPKAKASA